MCTFANGKYILQECPAVVHRIVFSCTEISSLENRLSFFYLNLIVNVKVAMNKIGTIARQAGVTTRTVRYYEQLGLITPSSVSSSGYRYYNDEALAILTRIRSLQHAGLSLNEIKEIIGLYFKEKKTVEAKTKTLQYLQSHLKEIDNKIKLLNNIKKELNEQIQYTQQRLTQLKMKERKNGESKN